MLDRGDSVQLREKRFVGCYPLPSDRELAVRLGKEVLEIGRCRRCRHIGAELGKLSLG